MANQVSRQKSGELKAHGSVSSKKKEAPKKNSGASKVIIIAVMALLAFYFVSDGARQLIGNFSAEKNIAAEETAQYDKKYMEIENLSYPCGAEQSIGKIKNYYAVTEISGKYYLVRITRDKWEDYGFQEIFEPKDNSYVYHFPSAEKTAVTTEALTDDYANVAITYYNEHIGSGMTLDNYTDKFYPELVEIGKGQLFVEGCTKLFCGLFVAAFAVANVFSLVKKDKGGKTEGKEEKTENAVKDK